MVKKYQIISAIILWAITMISVPVLANTVYTQEESIATEWDATDRQESEEVILNEVPAFSFTQDDIDVTQYTYEVTPILAPFCYYVYVKTDNPDPTSFCLCDKNSRYCHQDGNSGSSSISVYSIFNFLDEIDTFVVNVKSSARY